MKKLSVLAICTLAALSTPSQASIEGLSANVSVASNYLFRGITQTQDGAAISGGIDYAHDSGFYVGTWASNVDFDPSFSTSYEMDIYAGYSNSVGDFGYDLGYIYYAYPDSTGSRAGFGALSIEDKDIDLGEIYASVSYQNFTFGAYYLVNSGDDAFTVGLEDDWLYVYGDAAFEISEGLELAFHIGNSSGDSIDDWFGDDYTDYNVSISKSGFSLMLSDTDRDYEDPKVVISYSMDIDL
jgi:uncharacterized protein (TIGR02001 family)